MKVDNGLSAFYERWADVASSRVNAKSRQGAAEDAKEMVQAAKENVTNDTLRTWDKHTDMVEKSQELRQLRDRKEALERQSQDRREEQTELMAKVAIENVNRSKMLEAQSLARRDEEEFMLVA